MVVGVICHRRRISGGHPSAGFAGQAGHRPPGHADHRLDSSLDGVRRLGGADRRVGDAAGGSGLLLSATRRRLPAVAGPRILDQLPTRKRRSGPVRDREFPSAADHSRGPSTPPVPRPATAALASAEVRLPSNALAEISDRELCLAWRVSFVLLQHLREIRHIQAQCRVVGLRQLDLDEMERRQPQGFARWLPAGARPASDPCRYLWPTDECSSDAREQDRRADDRPD